ncbi:MAG: D-2-hydroxyacid dehydrogenase [Gammaproteobacteria bacterium]
MKICISEFTLKGFRELLEKSLQGHEIILIDDKGLLKDTSTKPDVFFLSYEVMFKALADEEYKNNLLNSLQDCEFVQGSWAGTESEFAQEIISRVKVFSHGGGIHAITIATYVFSQILRVVKDIDSHIEKQKNKDWTPMMLTGELTDLTIGIAGFGGIGQEVGRLAKAFRMRVLATKRTPVDSGNLDQLFKPSDLNEMLKESDFVVNCLPVTNETYKIFGNEQFKSMKDSSMFINIGRGETVNEDELHEALVNGEISLAALDTTDPEPLPNDSPLWELKNCFITPHDSAWGPKAPERAIELLLDNISRYEKGEKILNKV